MSDSVCLFVPTLDQLGSPYNTKASYIIWKVEKKLTQSFRVGPTVRP